MHFSCSLIEKQKVFLNDEEPTGVDNLGNYKNECAGCKKAYKTERKKKGWISYLICGRWLRIFRKRVLNIEKTQCKENTSVN